MRAIHISEPTLLFGLQQLVEDPRDGLTLFGPLDKGAPYGIRWAVVGPPAACERLKRWVASIQHPVIDPVPRASRPFFPGFEAAFRIPWAPDPVYEVDVPDLPRALGLADRHQRVYR